MTLPQTPEYYSIDEMFSVWAESAWWHEQRKDALREIRGALREFREDNIKLSRQCRKRYLIAKKAEILEKIITSSELIDGMEIPEDEKKFLMQDTKVLRKIIKKINGELRYVYGAPKGSIDDEDIRRAREVPIMSLDLIQGTKRSGNGRHVASCLFHDEKTASMTIYPGNRGFTCFGACGKSGTAIDIVMHVMNLDFIKAVKYLRGK